MCVVVWCCSVLSTSSTCLCSPHFFPFVSFFFNDTAPTEIYTLSLHDAFRSGPAARTRFGDRAGGAQSGGGGNEYHWIERSEEHTSELQSLRHLVCRLLLEKKKKTRYIDMKNTRQTMTK